jgi:flagellar motility protein MotE (MotC chaperone)
MSDNNTLERLASLEAKLQFVKELLQEIRDDIKNQPNREEVDKLEERISVMESKYQALAIKVGIASALLGMLGGSIIKFLMH